MAIHVSLFLTRSIPDQESSAFCRQQSSEFAPADPEYIIGTMKDDYELTMEQAAAKRAPEIDENEMAPGPKTPQQEAAEKAKKRRTYGWSARGLMSDANTTIKYVDDTDSSDSEDEE